MTRPIRNNARLQRNPRAFTLIELMVVIGIIGLLVAIVVPAVGKAREAAKVVADKSFVATLDTSITSYRADQVIGGDYPPSSPPVDSGSEAVANPHSGSSTQIADGRVTGAYLLAWALLGADQLGAPGFIDLNGNGAWNDDTTYQAGGLYEVNQSTGQTVKSRVSGLIDADKVRLPTPGFGQYTIPKLPSAGGFSSIFFIDSFNQPVLYYKATPAQAFQTTFDSRVQAGTYDLRDNQFITGNTGTNMPGKNFGADFYPAPADANRVHPMGTFETSPLMLDPTSGDYIGLKPSFQKTLWNPDVTAAYRTYGPDSYVIILAGPDGLYGTSDDITSFGEAN